MLFSHHIAQLMHPLYMALGVPHLFSCSQWTFHILSDESLKILRLFVLFLRGVGFIL